MRRSWLEQIQTEAKQKALQDLQDYTHNLEVMYNSLRSFKHDYVNILLSLYGYHSADRAILSRNQIIEQIDCYKEQ